MAKQPQRVIVGMSGGVDSSVAAALLCEQGFEVVGCSLNVASCDRPIERSCCSAEDREDARRVCGMLGIEHATIDCRTRFREAVIDAFVDDYLAGRTPSPCCRCNERVKFAALLEEADRRHIPWIATGHYASLRREGGVTALGRGADPGKDQSYFLFGLAQAILARTIFPLDRFTKGAVRQRAKELHLPTREKPESQEVCFVPDDDYVGFLEARAGARLAGPGSFVDAAGNILGRHQGIHAYTIGQRRGLGFGIGKRQYVVRIDAARNEIVLGDDDDLRRTEMTVRELSWIAGRPPAMTAGAVQIRSTHTAQEASWSIEGDAAAVRFSAPVRAIAPGQAAVFFHGDEVLGGGWIA